MSGKYQEHSSYIETGVKRLGRIPSHWVLKRLKQMARIKNGQDYKHVETENVEESYPVIGSGGRFAFATEFIFEGESVLLGRKGTIDKPLYVNSAFWTVDTMFYTQVFKDTCARYLYYCSVTIPFSYYSTNTALPSMTQEDLGGNYFAVPDCIEQKQIANFLDHETAKIDTLIDKQQQLIKLLKEKRQALISHAVTKGLNPDAPMKDSGVEWLGEVPEHWDVAKLSYRYEVLLGKMLDDKKITGTCLGKYLRNTDVQWDRINTEDLPEMDFRPEERERFSIRKGDLIVCEGGEIGRSAIWEKAESCFYQKALHRLRPVDSRKDNTRFMFYVLYNAVHQERFVSGAGKATIAHLPAETFKQFRFSFPPLQEQLLIAKYIDGIKGKFDLIEQKANSQIAFLQERRTALISAAVTGKIDVRNWEPAPYEPNREG